MEYQGIKTTAQALVAKIEALNVGEAKLFNAVKCVAVTGGEHAAKAVATITKYPAAIVCLGSAEPQDAMTHRDLTFRVIVLCPFSAGANDAGFAAWDVLDALDRAFAPDEDERPCLLGESPCFAGPAEPLYADTASSAYVFTVNVF